MTNKSLFKEIHAKQLEDVAITAKLSNAMTTYSQYILSPTTTLQREISDANDKLCSLWTTIFSNTTLRHKRVILPHEHMWSKADKIYHRYKDTEDRVTEYQIGIGRTIGITQNGCNLSYLEEGVAELIHTLFPILLEQGDAICKEVPTTFNKRDRLEKFIEALHTYHIAGTHKLFQQITSKVSLKIPCGNQPYYTTSLSNDNGYYGTLDPNPPKFTERRVQHILFESDSGYSTSFNLQLIDDENKTITSFRSSSYNRNIFQISNKIDTILSHLKSLRAQQIKDVKRYSKNVDLMCKALERYTLVSDF